MKKLLIVVGLVLFAMTGCTAIEEEMQWDAVRAHHNKWARALSDYGLDDAALKENERQRNLEREQLLRLMRWHNKKFK